ncbi:MAG: hypothetical protein DHS20C19_00910 [Acidimicrobiales bacterium]|nr:MAG: hypothetical protein DHS20C19_00910 [Acidimicrobiales bacterium]
MAERASRRSREQTKKLVLDAAVDLVRIEGLGAEPTTVSYQKVFDHLEETMGVRVTRASVHERIWVSQEDFQFEVLELLSSTDSGMQQTYTSAIDVFEETADLHPIDRMREMTRVAADVNLAVAQGDPRFFSWVGMTMSLAADAGLSSERAEQLRVATSTSYGDFEAAGVELLRGLAQILGLRPRVDLFAHADTGFSLIANLGIALSEGSTLRTRFDPTELPTQELSTGASGEPQEWSAFAAGYWALLNSFLEVDPLAHPDLVEGD